MKEITISQLVSETGINSSAIRYYEKEGLIHSIGRKGLQRVFSIQVMEQLALIMLAKQAGFSIAEIETMLQKSQSPIDKTKLKQRASQIDQQIKEMQILSKMLHHVAHCSFENSLDCPKFQRILAKVKKSFLSKSHSS
ncbi:MerR family transcriptional regulator [Acinetobacter guerrae]|uniref:MerR family transcriptional regulator n=1 Tax=Acinetobacter guerrae TaxID=1843371 RepID=A0A3A8F1R4_9GAMM|nr:helix-turn-helix domain-containing protein [Acinetobacter guerrae]RKG36264.1 MerR family transcriptional regulator [Acinetobacter guerrae]